jgi:hypothetical protein
MPSEIREPLNNTVIARGDNVVKQNDQYLVSKIVPYPNDYLNSNHVGDSFRVKDTGDYQNGILLELVNPPGGGMQTATFQRPE